MLRMIRLNDLLPSQPWHLAELRLRVVGRVALARAFALDLLDAVASTAGVERVVVASGERELIVVARRIGADLVADRPLLPGDGLDAVVNLGCRWALRSAPRTLVVVVPVNLSRLTQTTLGRALRRLTEYDRAFVPDLGAAGTTLVTAASSRELTTRYGSRAEARHVRTCLRRVNDVDPAVRRDVDVLDHLGTAHGLGLGRHTRAATAVSSSEPRVGAR